MLSASYKKRFATALAGAALASALVVSAASAVPAEELIPSTTQQSPPEVPPPPSSIAAPAGEKYEALRAPDGRQPADPVAEPRPVVDEPSEPGGFDWVSAAIGAVAAAGVSLLLMATLGLRRRTGRGVASA
jgi:hypothetical protein